MSTPVGEVQAGGADDASSIAHPDEESDSFSDDIEDEHVSPATPGEALHNPFTEDETYYTRPNRYYGPASTWLEWTKDERAVTDSLKQIRSQDLSRHLYKAHVLKGPVSGLKTTDRKGKARAVDQDEDLDGESTYKVPKLWTAWPMPPAEVPREDFLPTPWGEGGVRAAGDARPSAALEECLMAATMRIARQRWKARRWAWRGPKSGDPEPESEDGVLDDTLSQIEASPDRATSPVEQLRARQMFTSQMTDNFGDEASELEADERSEEDKDPNAIKLDARPVPMVDEDKIGALLGPSTRHTISKVDDLLLGLHKARRAYAERPQGTAHDETTADEQTDAEAEHSSRGRRRTSLKRRRGSSAAREDVEVAELSTSSHKASKRQSTAPLRLRDWSDVLGMAALTGWDPTIVKRASARCANLFGENMLFRHFHEANEAYPRSHFTEQLATGEEPLYEDDEIGKDTERLSGEGSSSGIYETLTKRTCPHASCPRHLRPFKKSYHLERHVLALHNGIFLQPPGAASVDPQIPSGRPTDQPVCPVESCSRHAKPFSKGAHMYHHVRQFHPEVDVDEVKRMEAARRPERRGRWTGEKRHRNPYDRSARTDTK